MLAGFNFDPENPLEALSSRHGRMALLNRETPGNSITYYQRSGPTGTEISVLLKICKTSVS